MAGQDLEKSEAERQQVRVKGWDWRALLIVVLFQLAVFAVIYPKGDSYVEQPGSLIWQQPAALDARFPDLIDPHRWPFDFEAQEKAVFRIKFTESGQVRLTPNTANILERLMTRFPTQDGDASIEARVPELIRQVFPGEKGERLSQLVKDYRALYLAQQDWEKANPPESGVEAAEQRFEHLVSMKEHYLGKKVSDQLFAEQHRLARYIFERRRINGDESLNPKQRQARLKQLEKAFTEGDTGE